jgi:hypothetical protein
MLAHMACSLAQVRRIWANGHSMCLAQEAPRGRQAIRDLRRHSTIVSLKTDDHAF